MQVDVIQGVVLGLGRVLEAHVLKVDGAVRDLGDGVPGAGEGGLFRQDLADSLGRFRRDREHHIDHRQHHQAHEHLHAIGEHGGDLPHVDERAGAGDDQAGAYREDEDHVEIHAQLHQGRVERHDTLGPGEVPADAVRRGAEFLLLVFLA